MSVPTIASDPERLDAMAIRVGTVFAPVLGRIDDASMSSVHAQEIKSRLNGLMSGGRVRGTHIRRPHYEP
jgi:hypothetical protein